MSYVLQSLIHTVEQFLLPKLNLEEQKPQVESLLQKSISVRDLLEASLWSTELEKVENRIRDAAYRAEDIIDSYTADLTSTINSQELQKVMDEFISTEQMLLNQSQTKESSTTSTPALSSTSNLSHNNIVVGMEKDLAELIDRLTGDERQLDIIPIVGMGGVGKTTLARKLYDDLLELHQFDRCAWVTVSQNSNFRAILLGLLRCVVGELTDEIQKKDNLILGTQLYRSLLGRRYLIVLDDMWSNKVWDDINMYLPKENNKSRIILTTRESEVANYPIPDAKPHQLYFLNKTDSLELLKQRVFQQEPWPPAFQEIGEEIVDNCRGLPLTITVIGGLLSTAKENLNLWEEVAHNTSSVIADKDHFSNILSLSYNHLPSHLKPCFLYFGAFPEDFDIKASRLIRLWVAEGFLKPIRDKAPEEVAKLYLKSLVERNLILVGRRESKERIISYGIHDLLRELCMRKALEEKFLYVENGEVRNDPTRLPRWSVHGPYRHLMDAQASDEHISLARSFIYTGIKYINLYRFVFGLRLLKMLDMLEVSFHWFPDELLNLINLRSLALRCNYVDRLYDMRRLRNLQTLIFHINKFLGSSEQCGLWKIEQIRHVKFKEFVLFFQPDGVLEDLQTLWNMGMSNDYFEKIPNLRELKAVYLKAISSNNATDFIRLDKLETLKLATQRNFDLWRADNSLGIREGQVPSAFLSKVTLPHSLKKLIIVDYVIPHGLLSTVGSLPKLEVLKLKNCVFPYETEWQVMEGEFPKLQFLQLYYLDLVHWTVEDESCFPSLRHLVIRSCGELERIPKEIGGSLEMIEIDEHISTRAAASANEIVKEQRDQYGNDALHLRILLACEPSQGTGATSDL